MKTSVSPAVSATPASELSPPLPAILGWLLRLCSHERADAVIGAMPGAPVLYRLK
ncbi:MULTISPECIES: hypothetical protein [unclassified Pseudomonas]|uniref:hypothetical protein n=1 Tax=unclassified Pseudomonas TaxID=196821 RepID=UPI00131E1DD1|nr:MULTISPECIES: hypothetical protein [unclassified Pseudomonas]